MDQHDPGDCSIAPRRDSKEIHAVGDRAAIRPALVPLDHVRSRPQLIVVRGADESAADGERVEPDAPGLRQRELGANAPVAPRRAEREGQCLRNGLLRPLRRGLRSGATAEKRLDLGGPAVEIERSRQGQCETRKTAHAMAKVCESRAGAAEIPGRGPAEEA